MRKRSIYTLVLLAVGVVFIVIGAVKGEANAVLLQYIYENSVKKQVAGMSSAMAVILGLCIMAVTFVQMRMMVKNAQE